MRARARSRDARAVAIGLKPGDVAITALTCDANGMILVATMDRAVRVYDPKPRVRNPALADRTE